MSAVYPSENLSNKLSLSRPHSMLSMASVTTSECHITSDVFRYPCTGAYVVVAIAPSLSLRDCWHDQTVRQACEGVQFGKYVVLVEVGIFCSTHARQESLLMTHRKRSRHPNLLLSFPTMCDSYFKEKTDSIRRWSSLIPLGPYPSAGLYRLHPIPEVSAPRTSSHGRSAITPLSLTLEFFVDVCMPTRRS